MQCPICKEAYSQNQNIPFQLSCSHSLCDKCLTKIVEERAKLYPYSSIQNAFKAKCPFCKQDFECALRDLGDLRFKDQIGKFAVKNRAVLDAIEDNNTLKKKVEDLEDQMKEITCPMHQEQLILGCGQCETLICEECLPEHKDHQLCKKENVCQLILDKA